MPDIQLSDFSLAYEQHGSGLPLLFIHGYPLHRFLWEPQWTDLSTAAQVIVPDLRGHGGSGPGEAPHSMEVLAKDCLDLLTALNVASPVVVCGLSMGGYIVMEMQRIDPQRIAGLILAATRSSADSPEGKANRDKSIQLAQEQGSSPIIESMLPRLLAPRNFATRPDLVNRVKQIMASISTSTIIKDLQGMKERQDLTKLLATSQKPTLIIHGADDQIVPLTEAHVLSQTIPGAHFIALPDAGHLLNLEQPDQFNLAVRQFIKSIPYEQT